MSKAPVPSLLFPGDKLPPSPPTAAPTTNPTPPLTSVLPVARNLSMKKSVDNPNTPRLHTPRQTSVGQTSPLPTTHHHGGSANNSPFLLSSAPPHLTMTKLDLPSPPPLPAPFSATAGDTLPMLASTAPEAIASAPSVSGDLLHLGANATTTSGPSAGYFQTSSTSYSAATYPGANSSSTAALLNAAPKGPSTTMTTATSTNTTSCSGTFGLLRRPPTLLERRNRERNATSMSLVSGLTVETIQDSCRESTILPDAAPATVSFRGWSKAVPFHSRTTEEGLGLWRTGDSDSNVQIAGKGEDRHSITSSHLNSVRDPPLGGAVKVVSHNIMANRYVSSDSYPNCNLTFLSEDYRVRLMQDEIRRVMPDILLLEEISVDVFEKADSLGGVLRHELLYDGVFQVITDRQGKPWCRESSEDAKHPNSATKPQLRPPACRGSSVPTDEAALSLRKHAGRKLPTLPDSISREGSPSTAQVDSSLEETTQRRTEMDGVAIFYRKSRFELIEKVPILFNQIAAKETRLTTTERKKLTVNTHNVAVVAVLRDLQQPKMIYIVACVHLIWQREEAQLWQCYHLLRVLEGLKAKYSPNADNGRTASPHLSPPSTNHHTGSKAATEDSRGMTKSHSSPENSRRGGLQGSATRSRVPPPAPPMPSAFTWMRGDEATTVTCIVGGDFNVDRHSATFQYLRRGVIPSGATVMQYWASQETSPTPPLSSPKPYPFAKAAILSADASPVTNERSPRKRTATRSPDARAKIETPPVPQRAPFTPPQSADGIPYRGRLRGDGVVEGPRVRMHAERLFLRKEENQPLMDFMTDCSSGEGEGHGALMDWAAPTPRKGGRKHRMQAQTTQAEGDLPLSGNAGFNGTEALGNFVNAGNNSYGGPSNDSHRCAEHSTSRSGMPSRPMSAGCDGSNIDHPLLSEELSTGGLSLPLMQRRSTPELKELRQKSEEEDDMNSVLSTTGGGHDFMQLPVHEADGHAIGGASDEDDEYSPRKDDLQGSDSSCSSTTFDPVMLHISPSSPSKQVQRAGNNEAPTGEALVVSSPEMDYDTSVPLYRHNLRLRDAYEVYCLRHPNRVSAVNPSTVMEGKVLDHIFFDDSAVACARVLRLGEITDLPNATCPSDHYMAGAILVPRPMGSKSASPVVTQP